MCPHTPAMHVSLYSCCICSASIAELLLAAGNCYALAHASMRTRMLSMRTRMRSCCWQQATATHSRMLVHTCPHTPATYVSAYSCYALAHATATYVSAYSCYIV